jgi:hypothetical protein
MLCVYLFYFFRSKDLAVIQVITHKIAPIVPKNREKKKKTPIKQKKSRIAIPWIFFNFLDIFLFCLVETSNIAPQLVQ